MSNLSLKAALLTSFMLFASFFAGDIEGRYFPVATDVDVTSVVKAENGGSRVGGSFYLARPECNFDGLKWEFIGSRRNVGAVVVFEGGTRERDGGRNEFGPWFVQLTPEQIKGSSVATVYHKCPLRWWTTESHFYPH